MRKLLDLIWRIGFKLAYPLARGYWGIFRRDVEGTYVFLWHAGRILLIRNSYRPALTAPGGLVERGEAPRDTAARELLEEVGARIDPEALKYLGEAPKKKPGSCGRSHMFEVDVHDQPAIAIDNREVVWAGFMTPQDALDRRLDFALRIYLQQRNQ